MLKILLIVSAARSLTQTVEDSLEQVEDSLERRRKIWLINIHEGRK